MAYGYLGELTNRNLNNLTSGEGFYEVNNPDIVSSFNNYPDDSHILYKLLFQSDDLNRKYKIYTDIENKITPEILEELKTRHKAVYDHLSGAGVKVIKGILEIRNFDNDTEIYYRRIIGQQTFYRLNDNVIFQRFLDSDGWSDWTYMYTNTSEYLLIAEDVILSKSREQLEKAFKHYAPPYDDTRIKEEIAKRIDLDEFNTKLRYKNSEPRGTLVFKGGAGDHPGDPGGNILSTSKGPLILDTQGRRDGTGSFIHGKSPAGFYLQLFRAYDGMHLGVGHNGYSRVRFENAGQRGARGVYPTNIFWNDANNYDMEIQHLGRLQFSTMDGRWPVSPGDWNWDGWILDDAEEILVVHSAATRYGYGGKGSFMWPLCTRENVDIYPSCPYAASMYWNGQGMPEVMVDAHTEIRFDRHRVGVSTQHGMEFYSYTR